MPQTKTSDARRLFSTSVFSAIPRYFLFSFSIILPFSRPPSPPPFAPFDPRALRTNLFDQVQRLRYCWVVHKIALAYLKGKEREERRGGGSAGHQAEGIGSNARTEARERGRGRGEEEKWEEWKDDAVEKKRAEGRREEGRAKEEEEAGGRKVKRGQGRERNGGGGTHGKEAFDGILDSLIDDAFVEDTAKTLKYCAKTLGGYLLGGRDDEQGKVG